MTVSPSVATMLAALAGILLCFTCWTLLTAAVKFLFRRHNVSVPISVEIAIVATLAVLVMGAIFAILFER